MGYKSILVNQKTSLKKNAKKALASEFDNVYYKASEINFLKSELSLFIVLLRP
jgi:hypothetical protein